jgi:hypothetical protein
VETVKLILTRPPLKGYRLTYKGRTFYVRSSDHIDSELGGEFILKKDSIVTLERHEKIPFYEFKVKSILEFNIQKSELVFEAELIKDYQVPDTIYIITKKVGSRARYTYSIEDTSNTLAEAIEKISSIDVGAICKHTVDKENLDINKNLDILYEKGE